ncbi:riboflavin biosynthesis protein RibD [Candidatus Peregrinibacteria bacterium CG_4_9_14_0_2_um_filter_53_11]|nr:MAG: riboflavin biosynthesis protein RibD [Candidatus Peregrinibacteria bacterium CG_4_9_14_0_2_um_filter_53_11]
MSAFSDREKSYMELALSCAARGAFLVSPNPLVGAVLVSAGGKVLAEGWHRAFGGPHAERELLTQLAGVKKSTLKKATLYLTLEPCCHTGEGKKTPPCLPALIESGIGKVIIAHKDPNPRVAGGGIKALKKAGVEVRLGCLADRVHRQNERFFHWISTGRPFVSMKVGMSLDGKIATKTGESKWITGDESRAFVYDLRSMHDAILVGRGTVEKDNPRLAGSHREPRRIILDSKLATPLDSQVYRDDNVLVATTAAAPKKRLAAFRARGITLKIFPKKITLKPLMRYLGKRSISSVFIEGGAEVFGRAFDESVVDRYYWFVAPRIIGGSQAQTALAGEGIARLASVTTMNFESVLKCGDDLLLTLLSPVAHEAFLACGCE